MPGDMFGLEGVQCRFSAWQAAFGEAEEENIETVGHADVLAVFYDLHARHIGMRIGLEPTNQVVMKS